MGGAVIELGFAQPWEQEPPPSPRWPPRLPVWLVPALVAVATLLTVGAAAAPRRWDPVLDRRDQNAGLLFGADDTAYVTTQRSRSTRLQAYRPDRADPLWTVNFPGGYPVPLLDEDPGLLTLAVHDTDPSGQGAGNAVQGRDPRTGRTLWTRPGTGLLGLGPEVAVVTDRQEGGGSVPGPAAGRMEAVDRRTGQSRWTRAVPSDVLLGTERTPLGGAPRIVELAIDGRLRVSDPSTGAVRHEVRLELARVPAYVGVAEARVLVVYEPAGDSARESVSYDLASGRMLALPVDPDVNGCGDGYECRLDVDTLTVTDIASGDVRFQGSSDLHRIHGDRLIVSWEAVAPRPASTQVYDLRTGRRLREYPGWLLASFDADLLVQATPAGLLLVSTIDRTTGRMAMVGRASDWTGRASCTRGRRYLGCVGPSGLRVWRLPGDR